MKKLKFHKLFIIFYFLFLIEAFSKETNDDAYEKLSVFTEVLHYVKTNYVKKMDNETLIYGAIKGMTNTLDQYSTFMSPEIYQELKIATQGQFGGIGLEVSFKNGNLIVISPIEDTPAHKAGILPGDQIIKIDSKPTKNLSELEAMSLMRGPVGSTITITVMRKNFKTPKDFSIARDIIKIDSVLAKLVEKDFGYFRIKSFQTKTEDDLMHHLTQFDKDNKLRGIVIDLRNNPGGLLDESIKLADKFIEHGKIIILEGQDKKQEPFEAKVENTYRNIPMVVLINEGSASASEIVAGALKDNKRALLIGTQSFGKGCVQNVIELSDGSALKLTVGNYYTPNGTNINNNGIQPHVIAQEQAKDKKDYVLAKALHYLKNWDQDEVKKLLAK
jgi:carboxyl-terminal processing protease